ncbi:MAG: DUF1059 domain-containing protein [Candidatus Uhrbacteria bacterium]|nr:DUF1059 domain-containing protein [Candidatus Uhrbacteria bacterium]
MRKPSDCRKIPSEKNCDLVMVGSEEHLMPALMDHVASQHGHARSPELEEQIKSMLVDAPEGM